MTEAVAHAPLPMAVFRGTHDKVIVVSEAWEDLFAGQLPDSLRDKVDETYLSQKKAVVMLRWPAGDGEAQSFRVVVQPLVDGAVMVTCLDKTEVDRARAEAIRSDRLREQMLAAISHDLRAPMSTILLWERVLREHVTNPEVRGRALDAIRDSALEQSKLIVDLVDVSSVLSGTVVLQRERIEVEAVLQNAVELNMADARTKQLHVVHDFQPPLGHVSADRERLNKALARIVEQAVRVTPTGKTMTVAARRTHGALLISIGDVLRDRDERDMEVPTPDLGLVLANEVLAMHGGRLEVIRPVRGGAWTFWIRLPLSARHARA